MNYRKWLNLTLIFTSTLFALVHFQNCAPAAIGTGAPVGSSDSEVRIVDDWNQQKVSMISQVVEAAPTDSWVRLEGFCDRHFDESDPLTWEIRQATASEDVVLAGTVDCQRGGFRVEVSDLTQLTCGLLYSFEIRTVDGGFDQAAVLRKCSL